MSILCLCAVRFAEVLSGASPGVIGSVIPGLYHELWRHREILAENDTISTKSSSAHVEERDENDRIKRQGWKRTTHVRDITCLFVWACARSTRAEWNSCMWDHFIFDHLLNSYLWMPTKEIFYKYVRNATHGKKCYLLSPGIKENVFDRPAEVFHRFDRH